MIPPMTTLADRLLPDQLWQRIQPFGRRWHDSQDPRGTEGKVMAMVTDPVCGMEIDSATAAASEEYEGKTYYFCSEGCHQRFVAAPEQYAV